ncbi:hypothetical protein V6N12_010136 [Hibiscus sabdariffa]|uniref:Uncharacterized protein n=1 Tax=Hibiscus sabdariffa TaxID=183260 RepID=A0ABR2ECU2_9ROSI
MAHIIFSQESHDKRECVSYGWNSPLIHHLIPSIPDRSKSGHQDLTVSWAEGGESYSQPILPIILIDRNTIAHPLSIKEMMYKFTIPHNMFNTFCSRLAKKATIVYIQLSQLQICKSWKIVIANLPHRYFDLSRQNNTP